MILWLTERLPQFQGDFYRCQDCGRLLSMNSIRLGTCAGHKLKVTGQASFLEFCKILLGKI